MSESMLELDPYGLTKAKKQERLLEELTVLDAFHRSACAAYGRVTEAQWPAGQISSDKIQSLEDLPFLGVRLFKTQYLSSISDDKVFKTLYSSGTTGSPSRIVLDNSTAALQSRALVKIMQSWLGKARLPMLILDCPGVIKDRRSFSARGAGIQGLSFLGRNHTYALKDDMSLDIEALGQFCQQYGDGPVLLFGFTFMVWRHVIQSLKAQGLQVSLPEGILLHSGGWKKLEAEAVSNQAFKAAAREQLGLKRVHNFYGMVEQVGAIFVECEAGHLHCPAYADVLVRRPGSWQTVPAGELGVLQLVSVLPKSYPGHSLLTEDLGAWLGEDDCACGRLGRYFMVQGRLPKAEVRGCSDTFDAPKTESAP